jgi:hypothetical protein
MTSDPRLQQAFDSFDAYNSRDPHEEEFDGKKYPKELLYAMRMSERLQAYAPDAPQAVKLAARCQHIGRWEIPRNSYPMDRKGYLQWRSKLALYHSELASAILKTCGYSNEEIERVTFLLQKKQLLHHHPDTQLVEDVICLVFIEHYLEDFAMRHDDDKVVDILRKTIKKMSPRALEESAVITVSARMKSLIGLAVNG